MEVVYRQTTKIDTVYVANDGTEHSTEDSCKLHEWRLTAMEVFAVYARGQRTELHEVYSTYDKAVNAVNEIIASCYMDEHEFLQTLKG